MVSLLISEDFLNFCRYVADISRQRAEYMLKNEDKEGCFVVRNSSTPGLYTLSLYTKLPHAQVTYLHFLSAKPTILRFLFPLDLRAWDLVL